MQRELPYRAQVWLGAGLQEFSRARTPSNWLVWIWVFAAMIAMRPPETEASTQRNVRKEAPKSKIPTPPVRSLTNIQPRKSILPRAVTPIDMIDKREHVIHRVRSGDTLTKLLGRFNLTPAEKQLWGRSIHQHYRSGTLIPGKDVHFYFSPSSSEANAGKSLRALEIDYNDAMDLTWERSGRSIFFQKREKPFDVDLRTAAAMIDDEGTLFASGHKAGIQSSLLSQLADIFTWDVNLENDIRKGDSFKILYEQRSRKGQSTKASLRILAAELINAGQKLTAIYFEKDKGTGAYYDLEGRSLARSFLRFPLEFTNITSQFSDSRFHPVLRTNMPHTGVDFAAARGTPVRAVGDGVISQAAWVGSYGKLIEIQHDSSYMTRYAHLGGFAKGITNGTKVKKGQVIGFVGSTGRTTGPHLHFELYKDQQYVDPLNFEFPAEDTIEPALQRLFENQKRTFLVELISSPQS